jgi:hypothetical protein
VLFLSSVKFKYLLKQLYLAFKTALFAGGRKGKLHFKALKPVGKNGETVLKIGAGGRKWGKQL